MRAKAQVWIIPGLWPQMDKTEDPVSKLYYHNSFLFVIVSMHSIVRLRDAAEHDARAMIDRI